MTTYNTAESTMQYNEIRRELAAMLKAAGMNRITRTINGKTITYDGARFVFIVDDRAYNTLIQAALAIASKTKTYSVIVRDPNSWSESTGTHEELANCGHHHKSVEAAEACRAKLTAWYCNCGERSDAHHRRCTSSTGHTLDSTSATWYHAAVEENS